MIRSPALLRVLPFLIVLHATACLYVPNPGSVAGGDTPFISEVERFVRPGVTTRDEVNQRYDLPSFTVDSAAAIGRRKPDGTSIVENSHRYHVHRWFVEGGHVVMGWATEKAYDTCYLFLEYAEDGTVLRSRTLTLRYMSFTTGSFDSIAERELARWIGQGTPP